MKLLHIIVRLIAAMLIATLATQSYSLDQTVVNDSACVLVLKNTSTSTIWVSYTEPLQQKTVSTSDLEQLNALAIAPHASETIDAGSWFNIYTRVAQTNDTFVLHYTLVQTPCRQRSHPLSLTLRDIELNAVKASVVIIDHTQEYSTPEQEYRLCPSMKKPVWGPKEEQWFCKIKHRSEGKVTHEYVPVQTYIYKWLPDWLISGWYIHNPPYYHWYHHKTPFRNHLRTYTAPWQTSWYRKWYAAASAQEKQYLHEPEDPAIVSPTLSKPYCINCIE